MEGPAARTGQVDEQHPDAGQAGPAPELAQLPPEFLAQILVHLAPADLVRLREVSHGMADSVQRADLWEKVLASLSGAQLAGVAATWSTWARGVDPATRPELVTPFLDQLNQQLGEEVGRQGRHCQVRGRREFNRALADSGVAVVEVHGGEVEVPDHRDKHLQVYGGTANATGQARIGDVYGGRVTASDRARVGDVHGGEVDAIEGAHVERVHGGSVGAYDQVHIHHVHGGHVHAIGEARLGHVHGGEVDLSGDVHVDQVSGGLLRAHGKATITVGPDQAAFAADGRVYRDGRLLITGEDEGDPVPPGVTVLATPGQLLPRTAAAFPPPGSDQTGPADSGNAGSATAEGD